MHACLVEGRDDRVAIFAHAQGLIVVVADGAGGMGGGAQAAQSVIDAISREAWNADASHWVRVLAKLDHEIDPGQTTAIVACVGADFIVGASVGDSHAWWFGPQKQRCLTSEQKRKPLLGSGEALPIGFNFESRDPATLVVASDGLWNHAPLERIASIASRPPVEAARALVDVVKYPNGSRPDDVCVAVVQLTARAA